MLPRAISTVMLLMFDVTFATYINNPELLRYQSNNDRLVQKLFANYDAKVPAIYTLRPNEFNPPTPNIVPPDKFSLNVVLYFLQLVTVTETSQKVDVIADYIVSWFDYRLTWNPADYGGMIYFYLQREKVWIPELVPMNVYSAKDVWEAYQQTVYVRYDGEVGSYVSISAELICPMKMSRFPFDTQTCDLPLQSRSLISSDYEISTDMHSRMKDPSILPNLGNGEWDVTYVNISRNFLPFGSPDDGLDQALIELTIKRNAAFYINIFMIPSYLINVVSIIGIFIKTADIFGRLTVGLTNIMTYTFLLGVLSSLMPKISTVPILGIYFAINLCIIIAAVLVVLLVPDSPTSDSSSRVQSGVKVSDIRIEQTNGAEQAKCCFRLRRYHVFQLIAQLLNLGCLLFFCLFYGT